MLGQKFVKFFHRCLNDGNKINLDKLFNIFLFFFSLLSNAGLPETNPLLLDEDLDQTVGEDFQKMLNEWENHIGSLQVIDFFLIIFKNNGILLPKLFWPNVRKKMF